MRLFEAMRLLLKLLQRIYAALFKAKLAGADKTSRTVPIVCGNTLDWWVETVAMVARIATVA
jgi:hypothetical protein